MKKKRNQQLDKILSKIRDAMKQMFRRATYSALFLFAMATHAATPSIAGNVYLDQSKDIYFEQFPSNAFSLQLLQTKSKFVPHDLILGGLAEGDAQYWWGHELVTTPRGIYQQGDGLYLTQVTVDAAANFTDWSTLFLSVADSHIGRPGPNGNYVYLPNDFIVLGNLDQAPIYLTLGISNIPFGVFAGSGTWDIPLTSTYFSPLQAPQLSLGFFKNNFNAAVTAYSGNVTHHNTFAYFLSYQENIGNWSYGAGAGYLTYLTTDSTGNPTNNISRNSIPGQQMGAIKDVNANISYKQISLSGEYLTGEKTLTLNNGSPQAYALTATYTPNIAGKDTPFGLAYSRSIHFRHIPTPLPGANTLETIAIGLRNAWACSVSRPIFRKNITLGLDFERSVSYENHHTYTGTLDLLVYL